MGSSVLDIVSWECERNIEIKFIYLLDKLAWDSYVLSLIGLPDGSEGEESACNAGDKGDAGSIPGSGKISWSKEWQPPPVFLPGKFHGQKSLMGYSPKGCKESDMTEHVS